MVAPTFDVRQGRSVPSAHVSRLDGGCLRYRLEVVATSAADVVGSAGGWLYDRVMAGWEVTALLPHGCDARPLRILGVAASDSRFDESEPHGRSLAVSARAFTADARVRDMVLASLNDRSAEVTLWGEIPQGWPLRVSRATAEAQHLLSAAARTFKGHALAAAGIGDVSVGATESLLCDTTTHSPVGSQPIRLD